jgi:hypothetical protein
MYEFYFKLLGYRGEIKYEVQLVVSGIDNYWYQKLKLFDHLLAVCSYKRMDHIQYISSYYNIQNYINTWSDHWRSYDDKRD